MTIAKELRGYFLSHRTITNELINKIDKEHYNYRPTETSMSAQKLVLHMLTSFYSITSAAAKQQPKQLHDATATDLNLSELAKTYTEETLTLLDSISDEGFSEIIDLSDTMGMKLPAKAVIHAAIDHEINHKGNLFIYVREMGHTDLPMFVFKG
ncbi:DinB family protein [Salipaludibacillus sp. CF4.18]|uniref:DinB family protein n=1 Tax=Salipaludibacillus sp. CF4.18 TaxID=3373081 RepID=UPI003EE6FED1